MELLFRSHSQLKKPLKLRRVSKEFQIAYLTRIQSFGSAGTVNNFIGRYCLAVQFVSFYLTLPNPLFSLAREHYLTLAVLKSQRTNNCGTVMVIFFFYMVDMLLKYDQLSNLHTLCLFFIQGTQYHNAVQKFIDICKLSD